MNQQEIKQLKEELENGSNVYVVYQNYVDECLENGATIMPFEDWLNK